MSGKKKNAQREQAGTGKSSGLKRRWSMGLMIASILLIVGGTVLVLTTTGLVSAEGNDTANHRVSEFQDGVARHFTYKTSDGLTIRYFLVMSPDKKIRAALDRLRGLLAQQPGIQAGCHGDGLPELRQPVSLGQDREIPRRLQSPSPQDQNQR